MALLFSAIFIILFIFFSISRACDYRYQKRNRNRELMQTRENLFRINWIFKIISFFLLSQNLKVKLFDGGKFVKSIVKEFYRESMIILYAQNIPKHFQNILTNMHFVGSRL